MTFSITQEPLSFHASELTIDTNPLLKTVQRDMLMELIHLTTNREIMNFSGDLCDLLSNAVTLGHPVMYHIAAGLCAMEETIDTRTKLVVYEVLRYRVMNNDYVLSMLSYLFGDLAEILARDSSNAQLETGKCKLVRYPMHESSLQGTVSVIC